jgi:chemotaxis protein CheZ
MSALAVVKDDGADLESLFDSIVAANSAPAAPAANSATRIDDGADPVLTRVGKLTRSLHDGLRELGYDKLLETAAAAIPDTRDRLSYVATMTEKAAQRALNASEAAKPIQDELATGACALAARWDGLFASDPGVEEFKALVAATRDYLRLVPERTRATNAQLTEIMLAQDFQDLTGQVIKKITDVVHKVESQLVALLVENSPPEKLQGASEKLAGPVVNANGRADVVTSQKQVDELLESLGF